MAAPKQNTPIQANDTSFDKTEVASAGLKPAPQNPPALKDPPMVPPGTPLKAVSTQKSAPEDPPATNATESFINVADQPDLTYAGTETSDAYLIAKSLLNDGAFDEAMEIIGSAMASTLSRLPEESGTLHECMAPFYYLYGTTLLYSIEESTSLGPQSETDEVDADDLQISWENLETSRHIIAKMCEAVPNDDKLTLDLAQIHLRLGDVQKANDQTEEALEDYRRALELRQPLVGMYNRKVADLYLLSAMVYMTMASAEGVSEELKGDYTIHALDHYLACGKSFAGQIAFTCGHDPEVVTKDAETFILGVGKSSGMTEKELRINHMSLTMKSFRERVAPMGLDNAQVQDWKEILTEIQETIDEAEKAGLAMTEVTEMKIQAKAAVDGEGEIHNGDGSTTTIGFGGSAAAAASASAVNLDVVQTSGDNKSMMVVRKKKKIDSSEQISMEGDASKRAKTE